MSTPQTTVELIEQLRVVQHGVADSAAGLSETAFMRGTAENWSPADYLKHLILSVKPLAKAVSLPIEQVEALFGRAAHPSRPYEIITALYQARLSEGFRAEDNQGVLPVTYRFPEGLEDMQAYLVNTWNDANERLLRAVQTWAETDLDSYQLPHPAVGMLTIREMLYFTLHHNTTHWHDIERAGAEP